MLNPKTFWERKILDWEVSRYTKTTTILGRLAGISGASVRYRMLLAQANVEAVAAGRRVVELGCGSGCCKEPSVRVLYSRSGSRPPTGR